MIAKFIGVLFSIILVYLSDYLYGKHIKAKFDKYLMEKEKVEPEIRGRIIEYFKSHIDLLSYLSSVIAAIVTLALGYELEAEKYISSTGIHFNEIHMSEIAFIVRSLTPAILIWVVIKSFFSLPESQPDRLQKGSIVFTSILILLEAFKII